MKVKKPFFSKVTDTELVKIDVRIQCTQFTRKNVFPFALNTHYTSIVKVEAIA